MNTLGLINCVLFVSQMLTILSVEYFSTILLHHSPVAMTSVLRINGPFKS